MDKRVSDSWTMYEPEIHTTMANRLSGILEGYTEDCRRFASAARDAKLNELHTKFNLSWKDFCVERLRTDQDVVDAIILGVEVLGEDMPIPAKWAERVGRRARERARAARSHEADAVVVDHPGGDKKSQSYKDSIIHTTNKNNGMNDSNETIQGNTSPYALRRLKKNRPDLHTKCLSGELSTNAAMIQAGYRKKPQPRKTPVISRIQRLWQQADAGERQHILQWILTQSEQGYSHGEQL